MTYAPGSHERMPSVMLSSFSPEALGRRMSPTAPISSTWSLINRMIYVPFTLNRPVIVYKLWWLNGATVGTNNFQVAVYSSAFSRLILGSSITSAGANICQYDNITDTGLPAGRYFMCLWGSGTTFTVFRVSANYVGAYYETNAGGPQATGTPVAPAGAIIIPCFGLQLRSSP